MYLPYVMEIILISTADLDLAAPGDEIVTNKAEWNEDDGWQPVVVIR